MHQSAVKCSKVHQSAVRVRTHGHLDFIYRINFFKLNIFIKTALNHCWNDHNRTLEKINPIYKIQVSVRPSVPLLHFGAPYCTLVHFTALWCTLLHFATLWCILMHFGALYCTLMHFTAVMASVCYNSKKKRMWRVTFGIAPGRARECRARSARSMLVFKYLSSIIINN